MPRATMISIVISSQNRSSAVARALDSLVSARNIAATDWEVLVADNGSTDDTAAVCKLYASKFPQHVVALTFPEKGKSRALNYALAKARGQIIAFTDDDVICAPDYLDGIRRTFNDNSVAAVQGRVFLDFDGPRPGWFDGDLERFFGAVDLGDTLTDFQRNLFGLNMVVRREVIARIGGFSPELGPGMVVGLRDDSDFSRRIFQHGFRVIYSPAIVVRHQIATSRLDAKYVLRRHFCDGRSEAYLRMPEVPMWRYLGYVGKLAITARWVTSMADRRRLFSHLGFAWQHLLFRLGRPRSLTGGTIFPIAAEAPSK